jgi:hypothetical protein
MITTTEAQLHFKPKPLATISVDVDGLNILRSQFRHPIVNGDTTVYEKALPNFLELFSRAGITSTFFLVGSDLTHSTNIDIARELIALNHTIGNHSFTHGPPYARGTDDQKKREIIDAHEIIGNSLGLQPNSFRGPGFVLHRIHAQTLVELKYLYDTSILPCFYAPAMINIALPAMGGSRSHIPYGQLRNSFCSLRAHTINVAKSGEQTGSSPLVEMPVSVHPIFRSPFHATYVFMFGLGYFESCIKALATRSLPLNFVFHATDLLDVDSAQELKKFSTFRIPLEMRLEKAEEMIRIIKANYHIERGDYVASKINQC